jgi:indole-3-glycerol phosphate synthase
MSGFLEQMAHSSAERVARAKASVPESQLRARLAELRPPPERRAGGFDVIAELKLRSPAAGQLGSAADDLAARVRSYAEAGAAAVSVLTEPTRFDGSLEHLASAARVLGPAQVPAMRKDFLVDAYQVLEARLAGAGGVLIILRMLDAARTAALLDCAAELGLFALLEAFDEHDIGVAHDLVATRLRAGSALRERLLVGVNCRDLRTLEVVPGRLEALAPLLPSAVPRVAESGVASPEDAARVAAAGYDLALVGSALMGARDAGALLRAMLAAGRQAQAQGRA